jgi:hypothetical protein
MSAIGPKRTSLIALHMSAFGGKANTKTGLMAGLEIVIHFATSAIMALVLMVIVAVLP